MGVFRFDKDKGFVSVAREQRDAEAASKALNDRVAEKIQREKDEARRAAPAPRSAVGRRRSR
jgi:Glu-tRNA(Gln) amidotransferase subunit E-like FAD-binding protein